MSSKTDMDIHALLEMKELISSSNEFLMRLHAAEQVKAMIPSAGTDPAVCRGLRYANGTGVVAGVTAIGDVDGYDLIDGKKIPREGRLFYRGISIEDLLDSCVQEDRFGFEEVVYLLIFGSLPNAAELTEFRNLMSGWSRLPANFTEDVILRATDRNIMNKLESCILALHSQDGEADNGSLENELFQSFRMIARMPTIVAHSYAAKRHYFDGESLYLHIPQIGMGMAENFLYMLRADSHFTDDEAKLLDLCMMLHAEHGGGNNSTFACRVLTSSGSDFYSSLSAAVGSLKGFRHGGANMKVVEMMEVIKSKVHCWTDDGEVRDCLAQILHKEAGDGSGLIYGMGHAVYTLSDPRARILKKFSRSLAEKRGREKELDLIESVERLAPEVFAEVTGSTKPICANVDLYSGFVYQLLEIPEELYTAIFAMSRMPGWCAHRMEECFGKDERIMRPAYKTICEHREYVPLQDR